MDILPLSEMWSGNDVRVDGVEPDLCFGTLTAVATTAVLIEQRLDLSLKGREVWFQITQREIGQTDEDRQAHEPAQRQTQFP
ncbi:MAG: hypothetical protein R3C49_02440 [Planctomycetaceae bacterium]